MKLLIIAATAAALAMPAMPAMAQTSPNGIVLTNSEAMADGFTTHDECQPVFRQLRNDQRKSGLRGGEPYDSMSNSDYNRASRDTTRCELLEDGRYYVVFSAAGF